MPVTNLKRFIASFPEKEFALPAEKKAICKNRRLFQYQLIDGQTTIKFSQELASINISRILIAATDTDEPGPKIAITPAS